MRVARHRRPARSSKVAVLPKSRVAAKCSSREHRERRAEAAERGALALSNRSRSGRVRVAIAQRRRCGMESRPRGLSRQVQVRSSCLDGGSRHVAPAASSRNRDRLETVRDNRRHDRAGWQSRRAGGPNSDANGQSSAGSPIGKAYRREARRPGFCSVGAFRIPNAR